jgi:hypothetical protein
MSVSRNVDQTALRGFAYGPLGNTDDAPLLGACRWNTGRGVLDGSESAAVGRRLADGLIVLGGEYRRATSREVILQDRDVIVVQTKADRLGMSLLGQAFFSRELISELFSPRSVRTVALCRYDDAVLRPLAERFGIEVEVDSASL